MISHWYYTFTAECTVLDLSTNKLSKVSIPIPRKVSTQAAAQRAVEKSPDIKGKKLIHVDRIQVSRQRVTQPDMMFRAHGAVTAEQPNYRTIVLETI